MSDQDGRIVVIRETYLNDTEGYAFGDSDWYEPWHDDPDNFRLLFRTLQREYGRCVSKMFTEEDSTWNMGNVRVREIGWVFRKRMKYEDANAYYIREVWVERRVIVCPECTKEPTYRHDHQWKRLPRQAA